MDLQHISDEIFLNLEGWTPINWAAKKGNFGNIQILAPLKDNPNAADPEGWTPINRAAKAGNFKIIQILAPLSENPNARVGCVILPKVLGLIYDVDFPIPLPMNVSPSEKNSNFFHF